MMIVGNDRVEGRVDELFTRFKCGYNPDASLEMEKLISELTPSILENITPRLLHKFDSILHAKDLSQDAILNLAPLLKIAAEVQVVKMIEKLFGIFLGKTSVNREVVTTILKKIISQIPISQSTFDSTIAQLIKVITPSQPQKLELPEKQTHVAHENPETMVQQERNPTTLERVMVGRAESIRSGIHATEIDIKCDCLDILCDVLRKYGKLVVGDHDKLLSALLTQLFCKESTLRKKIVTSIASLVSSLSDYAAAKRHVLERTTIEVVSIMKIKGIESEMVRTSIKMIQNLSWAAGYHYGQYLEDAVPLLIRISERESEIDEELVVCSFQALRSLLLTCHNEISNHSEMILDQTLRFVGYDPNLVEDKDESVTEIDNEISDCNDVSWKVRSAALRCLSALIISRPEMISRFCSDAFAKLIDRSMERVLDTKIEVLNTLKELICQIENVREGSSYMKETSSNRLSKQQVPILMKHITRLLGHKSYRIQVGALTILDELIVVLPDCLADLVSVIPEVGKLICKH